MTVVSPWPRAVASVVVVNAVVDLGVEDGTEISSMVGTRVREREQSSVKF